MSFSLTGSGPSRQVLRRGLATAAAPASTSQLTASLLLSRAPLLTRTPSPLAQAYYDRSLKIRHALSNPTATNFYFKPGSLPLRRFQEAEYAKEVEYYGAKLVGKAPDVGDVQPEPELVETARDHWAKADEARGETSLERCPEEELFCLIESKGKWTFPSTEVKAGEGLDEAVTARITGVDGALQGKSLDTWLVTRKPIGVVRDGEKRNFFLRSHILGGEPKLSKEAGWSKHAWLTAEEVEARLRKQGDDKVWDNVKAMFGCTTVARGEAPEHPGAWKDRQRSDLVTFTSARGRLNARIEAAYAYLTPGTRGIGYIGYRRRLESSECGSECGTARPANVLVQRRYWSSEAQQCKRAWGGGAQRWSPVRLVLDLKVVGSTVEEDVQWASVSTYFWDSLGHHEEYGGHEEEDDNRNGAGTTHGHS
ncbi:54S ribosomal protein L17 mitochondrial [Apiotrichum porosum]|uniref:54S ribosomal protein L17 mitochondrial n=1 Tax=Apiotrichum porosum TaxID=105984 RepID=A0A427XG25_9TREE|nr:54S ribosomal protein L17 mitochondrial [Apiotrichum porosum]RSH77766.1 54S ribosomal protein L17 mitochondrial [Apiotrichum porosum]